MTGQQSWSLYVQTGLLSTFVSTTVLYQNSDSLLLLEVPLCTFCAPRTHWRIAQNQLISMFPTGMQDLHSFGNTTVCSILKKYEAILQLHKDTTVTEWMRLKQAGKRLGASSVYDLVQIVNTSNPDAYSNISKVVRLSPTLPLSSAACERGFSHLNIIKNKYRSRLSHARLSTLMHIHLSKQTTETFDPKQAVELWMETANRRLNQEQRGASAASSSSTMQGEAVDSGGDTEDNLSQPT
ncbi:hypothetical protein PAMP_022970 [Pampus punctatissimus]